MRPRITFVVPALAPGFGVWGTKVARTIADLAEAESIAAPHVAEAIQYRRLDRGFH